MKHQPELGGADEDRTEAVRLKFLAEINPPKSEVADLHPDAEVSFVPLEDFGTDGTISTTEIRPIEEVYDGYTYFREGDIAIAKITPSFQNGKGAICSGLRNGIGFGTTELHVLRPLSGIDTKFLWYALRTTPFMDNGEASMRGVAGQQRVSGEFVKNFEIQNPPLDLQQSIADFLDHHTARIDQLIEEKEYLLELLEEKRQAVTSQVVMKGTDPDVEMVDSGVEWVGSVPAHWKNVRIGSLIEQVKRPVEVDKNEDYQEIGIRSHGKGIFHKEPVTGEDIGSKNVFEVVEDALIFNIVFAWEGAVAVSSGAESGMIASHRFPMFVPRDDGVDLQYLKYFFTHGYGQGVLDWNSPGAAGRNRTLNRGAMLSEQFWMPPPEEQQRIVQYLSEALAQIDDLSETIQHGIELLKEKRQTLITAAVTGQIDVSEWETLDEQEATA